MLVTNTLSSIAAAIVIAVSFFFTQERIFPIPQIEGLWYCQTYTKETNVRDHMHMVLGYKIVILRKGNEVEGTVEKVYENSTVREHWYGGNRKHGKVSGYIEKRYFGKDKLSLLIVVESRKERRPTYHHEMTIRSDNEAHGTFVSTVGTYENGESKCHSDNDAVETFPWTRPHRMNNTSTCPL